ncbi:MAG TPA: signal peptide peptidase SppA [Verrucomicrobiae bacterium]|nr:signal peptide peptidase SppA [Verrucomicrobiae bacterium]
MNKTSLVGCSVAALLLGLVASLALNGALYVALKLHEPPTVTPAADNIQESELVASETRTKNKIAVIDLRGVISYDVEGYLGETMVDDVLLRLRQARADQNVKAIVLRVDSPGGEVNASDVLYNELKRIRDGDSKRSPMPIVCHFMSVAASGAYYAAMGSSYIVANDMTITGSVGVILQSLEYRGLFDKIGLQMHTFKSGKFKDLLSGSRPMSQEEMDYVQKFIMETYDKFAGIVARERSLDLDALKNGAADGRILSGPQALNLRFVDQLGYFEDALEKAKDLAGIKQAKVIRYDAPVSFARLLRLFGRAPETKVDIGVLPQNFRLQPGKAYFLSSHLVSP